MKNKRILDGNYPCIMMQREKCLACGERLEGRRDKKFCNQYCKSDYHYKKSIEEEPELYTRILKQLKQNRKILKTYNKAGKATVRSDTLLNEGFNPNYFTHYWKNKKNDVYLFVFEYGFLKRKENNKEKFILIKWQDYMD